MLTPPRPAEVVPDTDTHLELPGGQWALWSEVALRSAGFAADGVLPLSAPELARHADELTGAPDGDPRWPAFRAAFARAAVQTERQLQAVVARADFRTALTWQNHHMIDRAVLPLLDREPGVAPRNSRHRQREDLIASYWQRYCVKNDTIGFFGPVGWVPAGATGPTTGRPTGQLLESHELFFESWAIDQVADAIGGRPGMAPWLAPRRVPYLRVDADTVFLPSRPGVAVAPALAETLRRCDGTRPAGRLAADLVAAGHLADPAAVFAVLDELRRRRWIVWALELPLDPRPEVWLRSRLAGIGDPALREPALRQLDELERARARVGAAMADPAGLRTALRELDTVFTRIAGQPPTRNRGRTYGGRTLVYHDARRQLDLRIGAEVLAALAPIDLVLTSARWFTHTVAQELGAAIRATHARIGARTGRPVDLGSLWFECMSTVHGQGRRVVRQALAELQRRWAELLDHPAGVARVAYRAQQLRPRVAERFAAPHAGWPAARHVSPDVMVAAADLEAIRRGEFEVVLAELHLALVAYRHFCFVTQHPAPARLLACLDRDQPGPRLLPVLPKDNPPRLTIRTQPALVREQDFLVALYHQTADPRRPRLLMSADLTVEPCGDRLVVRAPGGETFDVIECFSEMLLELVIDAFDLTGPARHTPRITIDRLVVGRQAWRFAAGELDFATEQDEARRFVRARQWQVRTALPRHVFVSSPLEQKPMFIDLCSILYVNLLAKAVRRVRESDPALTVRVVEMLPTFDQLWLVDAAGGRYTSELRLAAVDLRPVPEPGETPQVASIRTHASQAHRIRHE